MAEGKRFEIVVKVPFFPLVLTRLCTIFHDRLLKVPIWIVCILHEGAHNTDSVRIIPQSTRIYPFKKRIEVECSDEVSLSGAFSVIETTHLEL